MIFLILGTQNFQMNRLLLLVDKLISEGKLTIPLSAQIGLSDYQPKNFSFDRFLDKDEFEKRISNADMIITHGGVSSIVSAINHKKPVIVIPRLAKYKEHVDDHQLEIARAFAKMDFVLCYEDGDDLLSLIKMCDNKKFREYTSQKDKITQLISAYLAEYFS